MLWLKFLSFDHINQGEDLDPNNIKYEQEQKNREAGGGPDGERFNPYNHKKLDTEAALMNVKCGRCGVVWALLRTFPKLYQMRILLTTFAAKSGHLQPDCRVQVDAEGAVKVKYDILPETDDFPHPQHHHKPTIIVYTNNLFHDSIMRGGKRGESGIRFVVLPSPDAQSKRKH